MRNEKRAFFFSFSQKSFQEIFLTGLTKLILSLKVIFFPLMLNKAAMYFVFVNVALLERGVGTSFS